MPLLRVHWTCHDCGQTRIELDVPAREGEDVLDWLDQTRAHVSTAHRFKSPRCLSVSCDLLIPFTHRLGAALPAAVVH